MKKVILTVIVSFIGLLTIYSLVHAGFFEDKIDKANKLIAIIRYQEAHHLIDQAILENPGNANVHYRAGITYLKMGWNDHADKCFDNVYRARPNKHIKTISKYYEHEGFLLAAQGKIDKAIYSFKRAFLFSPNVKRAVIKEMQNLGYNNWNNGLEKNAYYFFKVSAALDNTLGDRYSDFYFDECNKSDKPCFNFYRRTQEFSHKHDQKIGWLLVALAKTEGILEKHQAEIKAEAARYLSEEEMEEAFPPPTWQQVFKKTYIGVGHTGGDNPDNDGSMYTAEHGKDVFVGDRYSVIDTDFEVWTSGGWRKYHKGHRLPVKTIQHGNNITFRNEKGKQFTIVIERLQ